MIIIHKNKYLNNLIEQDHRSVKRVIRPMLEFKSFEAAQGTLTGIELMRIHIFFSWEAIMAIKAVSAAIRNRGF